MSIELSIGNTVLPDSFYINAVLLKSGIDYLLRNKAAQSWQSLVTVCQLGTDGTIASRADNGIKGQLISTIEAENYYSDHEIETYGSWRTTTGTLRFESISTRNAEIAELVFCAHGANNTLVPIFRATITDEHGLPAKHKVGAGESIYIKFDENMYALNNRPSYEVTQLSHYNAPLNGKTFTRFVGIRYDLDEWYIEGHSTSVSKAGCTWTIEFNTDDYIEKGTFIVEYHLKYDVGATVATSSVNYNSNQRFCFLMGNTYHAADIGTRGVNIFSTGEEIILRFEIKYVDEHGVTSEVYVSNASNNAYGQLTDINTGAINSNADGSRALYRPFGVETGRQYINNVYNQRSYAKHTNTVGWDGIMPASILNQTMVEGSENRIFPDWWGLEDDLKHARIRFIYLEENHAYYNEEMNVYRYVVKASTGDGSSASIYRHGTNFIWEVNGYRLVRMHDTFYYVPDLDETRIDDYYYLNENAARLPGINGPLELTIRGDGEIFTSDMLYSTPGKSIHELYRPPTLLDAVVCTFQILDGFYGESND